MSLWVWPGNLKCTPTGFTVSLWQGCVAVPTCSLNLFLKGLSVHPMYWGPLTCAHLPEPLEQDTEYTTLEVEQEMLEVIGKLSWDELTLWLVLFCECPQTLQSYLWPHILNPRVACLLHLVDCGGTLARTKISRRELVRE